MGNSVFKSKNKYLLILLIPLASFAYGYWVKLNFGEAELQQLRTYLTHRCSDKLRDSKDLQSLAACNNLQVKMLNIRGGLYFLGPTVKLEVSQDPSNPDPIRYLVITKPPWIGEHMIRRSGDSNDYLLSF